MNLHRPFRSLVILAMIGQSAPMVSAGSVADLAWLAGAWQLSTEGRTTVEIWMPPDGGTMLGMSRTVAKGSTREYEFLLIREERDGAISYVARPSGQPEAVFVLVEVSARKAVFENAAHDFPQRISYVLESGDHLIAAIEGTINGKWKRIEYAYTRQEK